MTAGSPRNLTTVWLFLWLLQLDWSLSMFKEQRSTEHSAFKWSMTNCQTTTDWVKQEQLLIIQATLNNMKLLTVDEVSMVPSITTILYIHMQLTETMSNNEYFNDISVVFYADILQLLQWKEINHSYQLPTWKSSNESGPLPQLIYCELSSMKS